MRAVLDLSSEALDLGLRSEVGGLGPLKVADNPLDRDLIHVLPASFSSYAYLRWSPCRPLREGLERTYAWIAEQVRSRVLDPVATHT